MSKSFTPEPIVNGCTQSHGHVFCCVDTTSVEKNKSIAYDHGAVRKPAPFVLRRLESRKKRYAPGSESATNQSGRIEGAAITLHDSPFTIATSSSIYFNTVSFMKTLLRKPGMLTMLLMIVSLFFVNNISGQVLNSGALFPTTNTGTGGGVATPNNAHVDDGNDAIFNSGGDNVRYSGFAITTANGGTVPTSGITIAGIDVIIEGARTSGREMLVSLTWNDGTSLTSQKTVNPSFTGTDAVRTFGGRFDTSGVVPGPQPN